MSETEIGLISSPSGGLRGEIRAPGDKSISHRALMLGACAIGETRIEGLLEGEDVKRTAAALRAYGADVTALPDGRWRVHGVGVGGFAEPDDILDMGNSGTAARLLLGLAATQPIASFFTGDASLRHRPMARVVAPLTGFGASFEGRAGDRLPLLCRGSAAPLPIEYRLPVASAQVKSAVLLAGLNTPGETSVIEPERSRDHSEHLLRYFGADLRIEQAADGARRITLVGEPELQGRPVQVPGDPSSAAFPAVAALLVPNSEILIRNVGMNPLRSGLYETLLEMGGEIALENRREAQGEPLADLRVRTSRLRGVTVPAARVPSMIDEYPILAVAAAFAEGPTVMRGAAELRVKESDRIAAMAAGLSALGVAVEEFEDGLAVAGRPGRQAPAGAAVPTLMDHRIAMAFLVYGMAAERPVAIDDGRMIETSFPDFVARMNGLGADLRPWSAGAP